MSIARNIPPEEKAAMLKSYKASFKPLDKCDYISDALGKATDYQFNVAENFFVSAKEIISKKLSKMKQANVTEPLKVLDLGCGEGALVKSLNSEFKGEVIATGITAFYPHQNINSPIKQGNFEFLFEIDGIKQNSYDVVMSHNSIMYAANPGLFLLNAFDSLKTQGVLLIDDFSLWGLTYEQHMYAATKLNALFPPDVVMVEDCFPLITGIFVQKNPGVKFELPLDYAGVYFEPVRQTLKTKYKYNPIHGNINDFSKTSLVMEEKSSPSLSTDSNNVITETSGSGKAQQRAFMYFFKPEKQNMSREEVAQADEMKKYILSLR